MDIDFFAIPWASLQPVLESGKLADDAYLDSEECESLQDNSKSFAGLVQSESYAWYMDITSDAQAVAMVEFEPRESFVAFTEALLAEEFDADYSEDQLHEMFVAVFSLESVQKLASSAKQIDIDVIEATHQSIASGNAMYEGGPMTPEFLSAQTGDFIGYLKQMIQYVIDAADSECGIAIHMG